MNLSVKASNGDILTQSELMRTYHRIGPQNKVNSGHSIIGVMIAYCKEAALAVLAREVAYAAI